MQARSYYELSESQVATPPKAVRLFWRLVGRYRQHLGRVLDLGAGDCRFACGGSFNHYTGIEIDDSRGDAAKLPAHGVLAKGCAFRHRPAGYDACIGNPPYVRYHDIEAPWRDRVVRRCQRTVGISLQRRCNLYLYFLCLALEKTHDEGLVALLIPYEWISRPSAKAVREYIKQKKWDVAVYRFRAPVFDGVLTTASISIIDKKSRNGRWSYYDITERFSILPRRGPADAVAGVIPYERRGVQAWAMRGLSPGSQKVFTLTEGERVHNGLRLSDVVPCVTTLKGVPRDVKVLTEAAFKKHFVRAGQRCWLIRSYEEKRSETLGRYLAAVPKDARQTATCIAQSPWFRFRPHPVPELLVGSGFTAFGPKVLINEVGARAVGSVYGIHGPKPFPRRRVQRFLLKKNFERQVTAHAKTLRKVEVKQLNAILNALAAKELAHGGSHSRRGHHRVPGRGAAAPRTRVAVGR